MVNETILTLVVTILSVDHGVATVDKGRLAGLRAGDAGQIYYQLTVGAVAKRIDVAGGTLLEVEDSRSLLRIEGDATVRPSYLVEFEIPLSGAGPSLESTGVDPALQSLLERLVPGGLGLQAEVARLIRERQVRHAGGASGLRERVAELETQLRERVELETVLRERVAELETQLRERVELETVLRKRVAGLEANLAAGVAGNEELRAQLEQAETRQLKLRNNLDDARADTADLRRQLEQAETGRRRHPEAPAEPAAVASPAEVPRADALADPRAEVLAAVEGWARAWSEQRADDYLALYARGFRPPDGKNRSQWEAHRRPRILEPGFIEVQLVDLEILSMDARRAEVKFQQLYRSDALNVSGTKFLELVPDDGDWKIVIERIE